MDKIDGSLVMHVNMPKFFETVSSYIRLDAERTANELAKGETDTHEVLYNSYARVMTIVTVFLTDGEEEAKNAFVPTLFNPNVSSDEDAGEMFAGIDGEA